MGIPVDADDVLDLLRTLAVCFQGRIEFIELRVGGQGAVQEEISGLFEGGKAGKVVDVVAPVEELSRLGNDEARGCAVEVAVFEPFVKLDGRKNLRRQALRERNRMPR